MIFPTFSHNLIGSDLLRSWNQKPAGWSLPIVSHDCPMDLPKISTQKCILGPSTISTIIDGVICGKIGDGLSIPSVEIGMSGNLGTPQLWWIGTSCFPICFWPSCGPQFVRHTTENHLVGGIPLYPHMKSHYDPVLVDTSHFTSPFPSPSAHSKSPKLRPVPRWGHIVFNVPQESYLPGGRGQLDASVPSEKAAFGANERQIMWGINAIYIYINWYMMYMVYTWIYIRCIIIMYYYIYIYKYTHMMIL